MFTSTTKHEQFWKNRLIDWKTSYVDTIDHPHRELILKELREMRFASLLEMGCASGPNLIRIDREFPTVRVCGIDINEHAVVEARRHLPTSSVLAVGPLDLLPFEAKSIDVALTDMALIYIGQDKIRKVLDEIIRVCRSHVIFVEFHSTHLLQRLGLKAASGYNAYNFESMLEQYGFHDVSIKKVPRDAWPEGKPQKHFAYIITARID